MSARSWPCGCHQGPGGTEFFCPTHALGMFQDHSLSDVEMDAIHPADTDLGDDVGQRDNSSDAIVDAFLKSKRSTSRVNIRTRIEDETAKRIAEWVRGVFAGAPVNQQARADRLAEALERGEWRKR